MKAIPLLLILLIYFVNDISAQYSDTLYESSNNSSINKKDYFIPSLLFGASLITLTDNEIFDNDKIQEFRDNHLSEFHTKLDNYLQFTPAALVYVLDLFHLTHKNNLKNQTLNLLQSEFLMELIVLSLKLSSHEKRPDGSDTRSFPSGHTAEAFMAATFLHKEFGNSSIWYSLAGYSIASATGLLRIANNKHWISDVFAGAAIGIVSTNIIYKLHLLNPNSVVTDKMAMNLLFVNNHFHLGLQYTF